ncbi:hypothetical protein [Brevibacterium otitidis]|uniref:Uncharacterized protein n=1 Tax=Brevibacterium otitidis TaxID=53364 RepID=A0ABV5WY13_9MICO|nr:hypothetical protein GCM10023233_00380 [Brevibacterium otitidis]BFF08604.1 hypothetical protein GCM10023233_35730 [Brevibacterium otitidis]
MTELNVNVASRRTVLAACIAAPAILATGVAAEASSKKSAAIPQGHRRGRVTETMSDGTRIYEVVDERGEVVGFTFDDERLEVLQRASREIEREPEMEGAITVRGRGTSVAACAAAIAGFVALTVFPAARVAKLAWRLGKLVAKYGPRLVARVFKGARGIAGRTVEKELIDLAKSLSGVAALKACGI